MTENYKIGLDFGTTNSILTYLDNGLLTAFKYGTPGQEDQYIPSFIAYDEGIIEIGTPARNSATNPQIESYGNFKMQLPKVHAESSSRSPFEVTTDYLKELLFSGENCFSQKQGNISELVISVPEVWLRDAENQGREDLYEIASQFNLSSIRLVSEPVAAAAYYTWKMQEEAQKSGQSAFQGNLLVCDLGGGTFDVSLCKISGDNNVEVLYFHGQGKQGLKSAGVAFDRQCVQIAYQKKHGKFLVENEAKFNHLLRDFESTKLNSHRKSSKKLENFLKDPDSYTKDIYSFGGGDYTVTGKEVQQAFEPIREGIEKVLEGVKQWLADKQTKFDRLLLVGGFSQFILAQKAITDSLNIGKDDSRFDKQLNNTSSAYAISYGACLIANGLIEPTEIYPHTIGIIVEQLDPNCKKDRKQITLIKGGLPLGKLTQINWYPKKLEAKSKSLKIPLWIQPNSQGNIYEENTRDSIVLPNHSSKALYQVGMQVSSSQIAYLIIKEINSDKEVKYELGNVIATLFPTFLEINENDHNS